MTSRRSLSEESKKDIKATFALFDHDHDGKVSKNEIGSMMRTLGILTCPQELDDIIARLDTDGNGYIDYDEFESFALKINMVRRQSSDDPDFQAAFDLMDRNKDGYLDKSELKYFMDKFGDANADDDATEMIKDADTNGDGKIDYSEYCEHMKGKI